MINLIPPIAKRRVLTEYWFRVVSVWLAVFSLACFLVALTLLPLYVLIKLQIDVYIDSAVEANSKITDFDNSVLALTTANIKAQKLFTLGQVEQFSGVLSLINEIRGENISISGFEFKRESTNLDNLLLNGLATDRKSLADFRDKLLTLPNVNEVNLPISNLAKDKNIQFSIMVTFDEIKN